MDLLSEYVYAQFLQPHWYFQVIVVETSAQSETTWKQLKSYFMVRTLSDK